MKNFLLFFLFSFFIEGVFGESVSVKEGDSVTLHTGRTEIQEYDVLDWRFGAGRVRIVVVRKNVDPKPEDGVLAVLFRDRLKTDGQTGDLTITNITTEHAGPYEISIKTINFKRNFTVIVVPADPVKTVSVMVGDSVTLNTGVPEPQRYDVMQWRFGHLNSPIAEINRKTRTSFTSNTDEGFKDRLQLDYWTGSLTIRNTETKHSGDYEYDISISSHTIHRSFTVTVSGEMKSALSVIMGDSVTLHSDLTEIQTDDIMQWRFGDSQIAEIYKADDRFSTSDHRLKLDHQTGSLTITDTRFTDSGLYELKISSSRRTVLKRIIVTVTDPGLSTGAKVGIGVGVVLLVCVVAAVIYQRRRISELLEQAWIYTLRILSVMEGERITLNPDGDHKNDKLQWMFRGACIAERKRAADRFTVHDHLPDERFQGKLELDHQTGSLTITNTTFTHSGVYELVITRSGKSSIKRFSVSVFVEAQMNEIKTESVKEGGSVELKTDVANIQEHDEIQWKFGYDTPLAEITRGTKKISPFSAAIFQGRLSVNHQTGSLTINKIRTSDSGMYLLYKIEKGTIKPILFRVEVSEEVVPRSLTYFWRNKDRNNPETVHLRKDVR